MKKWGWIIIGLGIILRVAGLNQIPAGVIPQEALLEYRANLLRTEGRDETGRKWPVVFSSFEGYQGPATSYLAMLGGTRWPMALISVGGLIALGVISKNTVTTAVVALSPTMIMLSRSVSEWNVMLNLGLIVWAGTNTIFNQFRNSLIFKRILIGLGIGVVVWWLWLVRGQFNFGDDMSIINGINRFRGNGSRWFYNKSYYGVRLLENGFDNTKLQYWFAGGGKNSVYGQTNFGLILTAFLPAFLAGLVRIIKEKRWWWLGGVVVGVMPSVLSYPSPNQEKIIGAMIPIAMICGWGWLGKGWLKWLMGGLVAINLGYMVFDGVKNENRRVAERRYEGTEEMAVAVTEKRNGYDIVWVSDGYCPDVGPILAAKMNNLKTNLWQTSLARKQWINQIENVVIGQKQSWRMAEGKKILMVTSDDEIDTIERYVEVTKNKKPKSCWKEIGKLKSYKLWENTGGNCRVKNE